MSNSKKLEIFDSIPEAYDWLAVAERAIEVKGLMKETISYIETRIEEIKELSLDIPIVDLNESLNTIRNLAQIQFSFEANITSHRLAIGQIKCQIRLIQQGYTSMEVDLAKYIYEEGPIDKKRITELNLILEVLDR